MSTVKKDHSVGQGSGALPGAIAGVDTHKDSEVQGEGDYRAARRHRRKVEQFIATSDTDALAREAAPNSEAEQQEMLEAERKGRDKAKGGKPENLASKR